MCLPQTGRMGGHFQLRSGQKYHALSALLDCHQYSFGPRHVMVHLKPRLRLKPTPLPATTRFNSVPIFQILLLAFIAVPIIEIYVLIQVGSVIGALPTVALVVFTAVLGAWLIRAQGFATVNRMRTSLDRGELPAVEMLEAVCLLVAGALLLTPGFVTDSIGFVLLIPALRRRIILAAIERGIVRTPPSTNTAPPRSGPGRVIEGEYTRED